MVRSGFTEQDVLLLLHKRRYKMSITLGQAIIGFGILALVIVAKVMLFGNGCDKGLWGQWQEERRIKKEQKKWNAIVYHNEEEILNNGEEKHIHV